MLRVTRYAALLLLGGALALGAPIAPSAHAAPVKTKHTATKVVKKTVKKVVYTCPMHPEVTSAKPGHCPKCGMELEKKA